MEFRDLYIKQDESLREHIEQFASYINKLPPEQKLGGIKPRALIVGGFPRDVLLEQKAKDADIEIYGLSKNHLREILLLEFGGEVNEVGESFDVFKVKSGAYEFDISIPRRERKIGPGHKGFETDVDPTMEPAKALRRRDFTVNALAYDPLTDELIDPFLGERDIQRHLLRIVDQDAFQEDPLRIYRAMQFAARFDFELDAKSKLLMKEMVLRGDTDELPKERITTELKKLLLAFQPSIGFELAQELGIIKRDYPELHALIGTEQDETWHPEGDVWTHTMLVLDQAAKLIKEPEYAFNDAEKLQVMLGCLAHDLGKPATTGLMDGRIRSLGHESAGIEPAKELLSYWTFGHDIDQGALVVTKEHLKPFMLFQSLHAGQMSETQYRNAVRRLLIRIAPINWKVLLVAAKADSLGRGIEKLNSKLSEAGEQFKLTALELEEQKDALKPLIQGRDLLTLGFKPGKDMGRLIKLVEDARDRGELETKEEAIAFLKTIA